MNIRQWFSSLEAPLVVLALSIQTAFGAPVQAVSEAEQHAEAASRSIQQNDLKSAEAELRRAVGLSPNNPHYLSELGGVLGMERKLEESTTCFEKALKLDPGNLAVRRNLASNQWQAGRFEAARRNLQRILVVNPRDPRTMLMLGMVETSLKNYTRAVELLEPIPTLVVRQPESAAALARSYYHTGRKEKARRLLEELTAHPSGPPGVFLAADAATDGRDYETAEKLFRSIQSSYQDPAAVGYRLALAQYHQSHYEESRKTLLDLIAAGHQTVDIYNLLAWCYHKKGKSTDAMTVFNQAISRIPPTESEYLKLGNALLRNRLFPAAEKVANKMIEMSPNSEAAYRLRGSSELELHNCNEAIQSFTQALKISPDSAEAHLGMALAQWCFGTTSEAKLTFEEGLRRFPRHIAHYTQYAHMLLELAETGDQAAEAKAVAVLQTAISIDGSDAEAHYLFGNFLLRKSKLQEAVKELESAARLDPASSKAHYALARAYSRLGRDQIASQEMEAFQKAKAEEDDVL